MPDKILLINSSSRAFYVVDKYLSEKYPESRVDVLVTGEQSLPERTYGIDNFYRLESERFSPAGLTEELTEKLNDKDYDRAYILCNDIFKDDYKNVVEMTKLLKSSELLWIDCKLRVRNTEFNRRILLKSFLWRVKIFMLDIMTLLRIIVTGGPVFLYRKLKLKLTGKL